MQNRILEIDLTNKETKIYTDNQLFKNFLGGTGTATELLHRYCDPRIDPLSSENAIILSIGPFSNIFPVATKTVALFKSPLTGELGESHAGGRVAMGIYNAGFSAVVVRGKSEYPVYLSIENDKVEFKRANTLWGKSALATYRILRETEKKKPGKCSIIRIGPAGERRSLFACVTADNQRHFGRLGLGAVFGSKKLKAMVFHGDHYQKISDPKAFKKIYDRIYEAVVNSEIMDKYHDLGTSANILPLSNIGGLPTRNFTQGFFEGAREISGEEFARKHLLQQIACAHCQCGCIHLGMLREEFGSEHSYKSFKVSYDYELIYSLGSNLSINCTDDILRILHLAEKQGWDAISLGVTLSWATEAYVHGIINSKETDGLDINFGDAETYLEIIRRMISSHNQFYADLEKGAAFCAEKYGGKDFSMVFGKNEAPGYMTGENAFTAWLLGVRHSHLDNAGYSIDQKALSKDIPVEEQVKKLVEEGVHRMLLNSLVLCLFARKIYSMDVIIEGLKAVGIDRDEKSLNDLAMKIYQRKYDFKKKCGFDPEKVEIPEKLYNVTTASGKVNRERMKKRLLLYRQMAGI